MTEEQEKMIVENQKLIGFVINKMNLNFKFNELVDLGMIGLIKGVKKFDKKKRVRASTYLYHCIQAEISLYLRTLNTKKRGAGYKTVSLDQEVCIGNRNIALLDMIADDKTHIEDEIVKNELMTELHEKINCLCEREKNIICHTFGILEFKKMSQCEIANKYKISQPEVSRLVRNILKKIRKELKDYA